MPSSNLSYVALIIVLAINICVQCEPVNSRDSTGESAFTSEIDVEYSRYLEEVSSVLDADENFQESIGGVKNAMKDDLDQHYQQASQRTRSKLDELKRLELHRLKELHKQAMRLAAEEQRKNTKLGIPPNRKGLPKANHGHIDVKNPNSFSGEDIKKLIMKTTNTIAGLDTDRRKAFKKHALNEAHLFKSNFKDLPPDEQQQKLREHLEKAKNHEKINHPGNLKQLKDVWSKQDFMGGDSFDPKTFFMLRDLDGDSLLSPYEVEAMFGVELDRLYGSAPRDPTARDEDMNRMREHIFTEVDLDKDGMVSYSEFLQSTDAKEFTEDGSWESVQDKQQFTDEELKEFEESLQVQDYS